MTNDTLPPPRPTAPQPLIRTQRPAGRRSPLRVVGLGLLCFTLSFLGAWTAIASGLIDNPSDETITEKRSVVSQEGEVVADVAERLGPSVVSVVTQSQGSVGLRQYTQQGAGTGIIITSSGYVLTNKHVVDGANQVQVVLSDGTSFDNVKVVGSDPVNDIAFLKIEGGQNLKAAAIGDSSQVEVGQKVIAIGNALGQYQNSVTSGIVSGLGRPLVAGSEAGGETEQLSNLLQTDAAINPGNSGGPLVNLSGEVIGINTAIDAEAQGIGFAIPINDAKGLIKSVTTDGKVNRAFLGVSHVAVTADVKKEFNLSVNYGAYVYNESGSAVTADSPAAKAGLKSGDVILEIDGKRLNANNPLLSAVSAHVPGDKVAIKYLRDGKGSTVTVTLAQYPNS